MARAWPWAGLALLLGVGCSGGEVNDAGPPPVLADAGADGQADGAADATADGASDASADAATPDGGAGRVLRVLPLAGPGFEEVRVVLPLRDGDVVYAGNFSGTLEVRGRTVTASGAEDLFVLRAAPAGDVRWLVSFGSVEIDRVVAGAVDPAGDLILVGLTTGARLDLGTGPLVSPFGPDPFVAKLAGGSGGARWAHRLVGPAVDELTGVSVDGQGEVYVTGHHSGGLELGQGVLASAGGTDLLLARYGGGGALAWAISRGGPGNERAEALVVDGAGAVLVAGALEDRADLGGGPVAAPGGAAFVARYAAVNGLYAWARPLGAGAGTGGRALALGPGGAFWLVGQYRGSLALEQLSVTAAGETDLFAARLALVDGAAASLWSLGSAGPEVAAGVAVDERGEVVVAAGLAGEVELPGGTLGSAGGVDWLVAKLGPAGQLAWARSFGGEGDDLPLGLGLDAARSALVGGRAGGRFLADGTRLEGQGGGGDGVVLELAP